MSAESVLIEPYTPEAHAPDPVFSHGDPTRPGKVGIWLFLASEIMFFVAILGSYIIYRSASPGLFAKHAETLSKVLAGVNTVILILSSLTMALAVDASQKGNARKVAGMLGLTVACATAFLVVKAFEYRDKFNHYTMQVVDRVTNTVSVYDGHVERDKDGWTFTHGYRMPMPASGPFDLHLISEADIRKAGEAVEEPVWINPNNVTNVRNYGPNRNTFFSSYFTLTGIHMLHVIGGMIPLSILALQALRGKLFPGPTENVGLYWHFVDLVWIFLFPLLYLI